MIQHAQTSFPATLHLTAKNYRKILEHTFNSGGGDLQNTVYVQIAATAPFIREECHAYSKHAQTVEAE